MMPKGLIDPAFIGLLVSVVVCSIVLLSFFRVMIFSYDSSRNIISQGYVKTGEYLSVDKSSIDWGTLSPAENKTVDLLVTNKAPAKMELNLRTDAWNPVNASVYLSLTWNYTGSLLAASSSIPVALTLHVNPLIFGISNFTFNIIISGVQIT